MPPGMPTEAVLIALIGAGQVIVVALIGVMSSRLGRMKADVGKVKKDAAAARWQVENTHDTNLREENDVRHAETKRWIDELRDTFTGQVRAIAKDIGGMREEIRDDRRSTRERFATLEQRMNKE